MFSRFFTTSTPRLAALAACLPAIAIRSGVGRRVPAYADPTFSSHFSSTLGEDALVVVRWGTRLRRRTANFGGQAALLAFHLMKCPACHKPDTRVMDSRLIEDGLAIRRRRECGRCDFRFSTMEEPEILNLTVIKRDGRHEPYSREKLEVGLRRSFQKLPLTQDEFKRLVNRIERDIQITGRQEIKSADIGEILMKHLKRTNQVAYIRFASVYRSFKDVATFQRELHALLKPRSQAKTGKSPKRSRRS